MSLQAEWIARAGRRETRVGIIGLGYVGLPLALAFTERGFRVTGFDVDPRKVEQLAAGACYIDHLPGERIAAAVDAGRFDATTDFDVLSEVDAVLICVPTPLDLHRQPDLRHVEATARDIGHRLKRHQLVVLESTTYPGTTDEVVRPILEAGGLACGQDFFLAYSPEREDPGNRQFATTEIPKVVGGWDDVSGALAEALYGEIFAATVRVSNAAVAEAAKLTENSFRAVNIALVNELKVVYDAMGIDVWEVIDAAATKPFGFMRFDPGPGWGGHCIPVDPFYLAWKAREFDLRARFVELAGEINIEMPRYVETKLIEALNARGKVVRGARILILGIAYKPDIADPRESPAFEIIERLLRLEAEIGYHDPHIPEAPPMRTWPDMPPLRSVPLTAERLRGQDAVLIVTHHSGVDYELVRELAPLVIDTRRVYREPSQNIVRA